MKLDESKIFTALNADGLKKGDKVITTYGLVSLKAFVTSYYTSEESLDIVETVQLIKSDSYENRIVTEAGSFPFAYLVEQVKEKKWRPYKNTSEMIVDFKERFKVSYSDYELPSIWVEHKISRVKCLITDFCTTVINMSSDDILLSKLFDSYMYLDGSPCGVQE